MKRMITFYFVLLACTLIFLIRCRKKDSCGEIAVITRSADPCSNNWGIVVNGNTYPSGNIPDNFKTEGMKVCVRYELYEDLRLCPCCGGTWANIQSLSPYP